MPRFPVLTRVAAPADLPALRSLLEEWRGVGGRAERAINPMAAAELDERLDGIFETDDCDALIATIGDEPAGMAVLSLSSLGPLSAGPMAQLSHLVVAPGQRRHGVGRALVAATALWAEERGIDQVVAHVYPSLRDANRFYARLGFMPFVVRRVAPTAVLRRRLGQGERRSAAVDVVRRRTLRRPPRLVAFHREAPVGDRKA